MLDLELMDKQRLLKNYNMNYEMLTKYSDNVEGIDKAYEYGNKIINEDPAFTEQFVKLRGNVFKSNREIAAFAYAVLLEQKEIK
jgi:hypothetical protein